MKKYLIITAASIIGLLILQINSFSQMNFEKSPVESKPANFVMGGDELNYYIEGKPEAVLAKAVRDFGRRFKQTSTVTWLEAVDGYRAKFDNDGITIWVDYDKKGRWTHTIRIYGEQNLPPDIRHTVKSNYYDHAIKTVHEIELPNLATKGLCYIIRLEDEKSYMDLRFYDGEMEVIKQWTKN